MKKFYCNGKIVYMHITHNEISAKILLEKLGIVGGCDNVCQALAKDQDMLWVAGPLSDEALVEAENSESEIDIEELEEFFTDTPTDEDFDHYELPNGKSAPYGLTGVEVAAMKSEDTVYFVSPLYASGVCGIPKGDSRRNSLLVAVDRDLIFSSREKAVEAYNALFGDLYGEI